MGGYRPKPKLTKPSFQLRNPRRLLSSSEFELLQITEEDLRLMGKPIGDDFGETAAQVRARSTILRRLLCDGDVHKAVRLSGWTEPLLVRGRVLVYDEFDPLLILSCGNYRWGTDTLPGMAAELGGPTIEPGPEEAQWTYREDVELDLNAYLDTTAFSIIGTRVRRRHVISYVANKKAAHVSDSRKNPAHTVLDHAWAGLFITREHPNGGREPVSTVYLELLNMIVAIAESESITAFIEYLRNWLNTTEIVFDADTARRVHINTPMEPTRRG